MKPDVVVVGGGVVGCACARELARRGARVVLVERDGLAAGASGRNHGLLLTPTDPALVPMARMGLAAYEEVADAAPIPVSLERDPLGFLIVALDEQEARYAEQEAAAAAACGVTVDRLDEAGLREAEPGLSPEVTAGWLLHDARVVDPAALTVALALEAQRAGAEVLPYTAARSLVVEGERVAGVATDRGRIEADEVVIATGPWSAALPRRLGIHLPVRPGRGWLVHLGPSPGLLRHVVEGGGWHQLPEDEPMPAVPAGEFAQGGPAPYLGSLLQPNRDGTYLVGGSRHAALSAEPEDPAIPRLIVGKAIRLLPALEPVAVISSWWGLRPMTGDGRPLIGRLADGLFVATGHGTLGVTLAGGTAALVAAQVLGEDPPYDHAPFHPLRLSGADSAAQDG